MKLDVIIVYACSEKESYLNIIRFSITNIKTLEHNWIVVMRIYFYLEILYTSMSDWRDLVHPSTSLFMLISKNTFSW